MTKQDYLNLIRLLSALESWGFTISTEKKAMIPDYLHEQLAESMEKLAEEILR